MDAQHKVLWFWIAFYGLFTIFMGLFNDLWLFDYVAYIAILLAVTIFARNITIPAMSLFLFGLCAIPHTIGTIPFMYDGQVVSLYHDVFFGGYYDKFTHAFGFMILAIGFLHFYMTNYPKADGWQQMTVFFALMGIGAIVEMAEFIGYSIFGFGWGTFAFGEGDAIPYFGAWGDSATDLMANMFGVALGFIAYHLWQKWKK